MENIKSPQAAQRPGAPRANRSRSRAQPEPASLARYVAHAMRNTMIAFTTLTVLAPLFPVSCRPLCRAVSGLVYADLQQQPSGMGFDPRPSRRRECLGLAIGLCTFIPAFYLQDYISSVKCADPRSVFSRIAALGERSWKALCRRLPAGAAMHAQRYPATAVLARFAAQMVAASSGSLLAVGYHHRRGSSLVVRPPPPGPPSLSQRIARRPEIYLYGGLFFSVPALLDTEAGRAMLQALHVTRMASGAIGTSLLVAAATGTAMLARNRTS
jgi:hypothetical protein